jgi:16S rRNA (uracil1498-N3)-methyltransferase
MRANIGDSLTLFDAHGNEYLTEITAKSKKRVTVKKLSSSRPERKLTRAITIVVALPKGDRQKFLIEKLVELGVQRLVPLNTARSVAQVNEKVLGRLKKQIIEATKQCRRSYLMEVLPAVSVSEATAMPANDSATSFFVAHPYTDKDLTSAKDRLIKSKSIAWLIGPEGGFSEQEFASMTEAGWSPVSFGEIILRVETAALTAAAISRLGAEA